MDRPDSSMNNLRTDIQALRGVAVGLVLLDHFKIGPFHQGFLGVDIFFVISGFLITRIIARDISEQNFSFLDFYLRRAKRILPATYATILLTSIGSVWFLNSIESAALTSQVIGALTFSINFVLLKQVNYFDVAAGFKPLLHLWSLAIEEQFYLLFPALLVALPRRLWLTAVAGIATASLVACAILSWRYPMATFYLLPTRAWELLIGALGALLVARRGALPANISRALLPALAAIAVTSIWGTGLPHPGADALIVCVATLVIILANNETLSRFLLTKALALVGNISYSLYLVHWPIIVFMNSTWITPPSVSIRAWGFLAAFICACLMYFLVEQPFRRLRMPPLRYALGSASVAFLLIVLQIGTQAYSSATADLAYLRRPNYGLNRLCDDYAFKNRSECRTAANPETLVWGDSYGMFFAAGAAGQLPEGMAQATYSACPPFIGYAPYNPLQDAANMLSKRCINFNDDVRTFAIQQHGLKTIILAASLYQYTVPGYKIMRRNDKGEFLIESSDLKAAQDNLRNLVAELIGAGKKVIVVTPPPGASEGQVICSERMMAGKILVGDDNHCGSPAAIFRANSGAIDSLVEAAIKAGASNIRLSDAICDERICHSILDGTALYRDSGHLSYAGSRVVVDKLASEGRLPPPFSATTVVRTEMR